MKLRTYADSVGPSPRSACQSPPAGTRSSSTMIVIRIATTPSLNASRRWVCTLPPRRVIHIERPDLRHVRQRPCAGLVVVEHEGLLLAERKGGPGRKSGAVGI